MDAEHENLTSQNDESLLLRYARDRDEAAFSVIVARHFKMVFASARRQLGDEHLADDVTQAVFIVLAKRAGSSPPCLPAWLLATTRYCAMEAKRSHARRARHEAQAAEIRSASAAETIEPGEGISRELDYALCALRPRTRTAIALRFLEDRSLAEVGQSLRISQDAAQKLVRRGLLKLRRILSSRGMSISEADLSPAIVSAAGVLSHPNLLSQTVAIALGESAGGSNSAAATIAENVVKRWKRIQRIAITTTGVISLIAILVAMQLSSRSAPRVVTAGASPTVQPMTVPSAGLPLMDVVAAYPTLDPYIPWLIDNHRTQELADLLDKMPYLIDGRPSDGFRDTPLATAGYDGFVDIMQMLVERGAYLEAEDMGIGNSVLCWTAEAARPGPVKFLLDAGADPNHHPHMGMTALGNLYWAIDHHRVSASVEEQAATEKLLIAAHSAPPHIRFRDRVANLVAASSQPNSPAATQQVEAKLDALNGKKGLTPTTRVVAKDGLLPGNAMIAVTFQAGPARAVFSPATSSDTNVRLYYIDRDLVPPTQQEVLLAGFRVMHDSDLAKQLKVSDSQIAHLKAVPQAVGLVINSEEHQQLVQHWQHFSATEVAHRQEASAEMIDVLKSVAKNHREEAVKGYATRAEAMSRILSADQLRAYHAMSATTQPASQ